MGQILREFKYKFFNQQLHDIQETKNDATNTFIKNMMV